MSSQYRAPQEVEQRKEVSIQTGGIVTVKQKSTKNFIPSGKHQLLRSPLGVHPRQKDKKQERAKVLREKKKIDVMLKRMSSISVNSKSRNLGQNSRKSSRKVKKVSGKTTFDSMMEGKSLQPIKTTSQGVLLVLMSN